MLLHAFLQRRPWWNLLLVVVVERVVVVVGGGGVDIAVNDNGVLTLW
jgi:hypothetical protein